MPTLESDAKSDLGEVKDKLKHVSRGTWIGIGVAVLGILVVIAIARRSSTPSTPTLADVLGTSGTSGGSTSLSTNPLDNGTQALADQQSWLQGLINALQQAAQPVTQPLNNYVWPTLPAGNQTPFAPVTQAISSAVIPTAFDTSLFAIGSSAGNASPAQLAALNSGPISPEVAALSSPAPTSVPISPEVAALSSPAPTYISPYVAAQPAVSGYNQTQLNRLQRAGL